MKFAVCKQMYAYFSVVASSSDKITAILYPAVDCITAYLMGNSDEHEKIDR